MGFLDYEGFDFFVASLAEELKKVYAKITHTHEISEVNGIEEAINEKVADIKVPTKVSELENDSGYLNSITKNNVIDALGYTPADSASGGAQIVKAVGTFNGLGWVSNSDGTYTQAVTVAGVTASNDIIVSPSLAYKEIYMNMGCEAIAQAENSITFKCTDPQDVAITIEVLIFNL